MRNLHPQQHPLHASSNRIKPFSETIAGFTYENFGPLPEWLWDDRAEHYPAVSYCHTASRSIVQSIRSGAWFTLTWREDNVPATEQCDNPNVLIVLSR